MPERELYHSGQVRFKYRGACECGWRGSWRAARRDAENDEVEHVCAPVEHVCTFYCCPLCHTHLLDHEAPCQGPLEKKFLDFPRAPW